MTSANATATDQERAEYQRAVQLLRAGQIGEGARLLDGLAARTEDPDLRAGCRFNLAETFAQLGRVAAAYDIWYSQSHQPLDHLRPFDRMARLKVTEFFEAAGLQLPVPDFPPKVQIEVTNRCNLRCIMCTHQLIQRPATDLSMEHFKMVADDCGRGPGCIVQLFFLGEPLLHSRLEEMVAYLDQLKDRPPLKLRFGIQTNAMLLTRERARSLLAAGLRHVACSVDGLEGDLERIRPGAVYATVEKNILDLLALREELGLGDLRVEISKLCDDPEADEVRRFRDRWEGRVDRVLLTRITKVPGSAYMAADGTIRCVDADPCVLGRRYCGEGARLLVHADGHYGFCCSDVNHELKLGHVEQRSLTEAWTSPEIDYVRRKIITSDYAGLAPCERCPQSRA